MGKIYHGTKGYGQGCRCDTCRQAKSDYVAKRMSDPAVREAHYAARARRRAHNNRKKVKPLTKPLAELIVADRLLRGGASYAETGRTVGWAPETVARHFPNRGWSSQQTLEYARLSSKFNSL